MRVFFSFFSPPSLDMYRTKETKNVPYSFFLLSVIRWEIGNGGTQKNQSCKSSLVSATFSFCSVSVLVFRSVWNFPADCVLIFVFVSISLQLWAFYSLLIRTKPDFYGAPQRVWNIAQCVVRLHVPRCCWTKGNVAAPPPKRTIVTNFGTKSRAFRVE